MSVMEMLKALFQSPDLPDETRQIYRDAGNPRDLIKGLEILRGRNEIDLRENEQELIGLEKAIALEEDGVRKGGLTRTEETIALRRIDRLEKQKANIERQVSIFNQNVNLHLELIAKIQEVEAMRSRGVDEDQIDGVVNDVEDSVQNYRRVSIAAESGSAVAPAVDEAAERRRLEEIRRRIMGQEEKARTPVVEDAPRDRTLE